MSAAGSGWRVRLTAPPAAIPAIEAAVEAAGAPGEDPPSLSWFEPAAAAASGVQTAQGWQVSIHVADAPAARRIASAIEAAREIIQEIIQETNRETHPQEPIREPAREAAVGEALAPAVVEPVAERDWVSESQRYLSPVTAGRFFVHGRHDRARRRPFGHNLEIEAGRAFGTGKHATTEGCLVMIDRLAKARRFARPLDLGCGSGVLALAMAKTWRVPVSASDIDPVAAATAAENARINRVPVIADPAAGWGLVPRAAAGLADPLLRENAPYDLIAANILAAPLIALTPALARALAPGGRLLLAGLLKTQEQALRAAYRRHRLHPIARHQIGGWPTLLLGQ